MLLSSVLLYNSDLVLEQSNLNPLNPDPNPSNPNNDLEPDWVVLRLSGLEAGRGGGITMLGLGLGLGAMPMSALLLLA
jgi:hypothetical protein